MLWQYLQVCYTYRNHNLLCTAQTQSTNEKCALKSLLLLYSSLLLSLTAVITFKTSTLNCCITGAV